MGTSRNWVKGVQLAKNKMMPLRTATVADPYRRFIIGVTVRVFSMLPSSSDEIPLPRAR